MTGALQIAHPTANRALKALEKEGILHEITGGSYGRMYAYNDYLEILNESGPPL